MVYGTVAVWLTRPTRSETPARPDVPAPEPGTARAPAEKHRAGEIRMARFLALASAGNADRAPAKRTHWPGLQNVDAYYS